MAKEARKYSKPHEIANITTHGMGLLLSLIFVPILISKAIKTTEVAICLGVIIFGVCLIHTYMSSTLYHSMSKIRLKAIFRKWDHISIYMLIGGTYTAFILSYYNEPGGLQFLLMLWLIIAAGILFKIFYIGKFEFLSVLVYVILGWLFVFIYDPLSENMSALTLNLLIIGGLFYTVGVLFYVAKKIPFHHAIWHLFVMAGSTGHFMAIFYGLY